MVVSDAETGEHITPRDGNEKQLRLLRDIWLLIHESIKNQTSFLTLTSGSCFATIVHGD